MTSEHQTDIKRLSDDMPVLHHCTEMAVAYHTISQMVRKFHFSKIQILTIFTVSIASASEAKQILKSIKSLDVFYENSQLTINVWCF